MPLNLDIKELETWKAKAKEEQNYFGNLLGKTEWHKIDKNSSCQLQQKICFGLYGLPKSELCTEDNYSTSYSQLQLSHTHKVVKLIILKHEQCTTKYVYMSFIFVSVKCEKSENIVPIIRIPRFRKGSKVSHLFIDADLRLYKDWRDYVKHNKLPKCVMCYPCNGMYMFEQDTVLVEFSESPACSILNSVVIGCDIASMVTSLGTAGMLVTSAFLPLGVPVSIGAAVVVFLTGAYSTGRNISTLVDRGQHCQSIGLDNAESRNSWLGITGSTLGIASGGMVATNSRMILAGESLGAASQIGLRSIAIGSCTVGALSITNGIANIMQKRAIKKEDILHLCSSVLFFTNAVITTYQANLLINSLRQSESSNSFSSILAKISEFTGGNSLSIDNQTLISIIQQSNSALLSLGLIGPNCARFIDMCAFAFDRLCTATMLYRKGTISLLEYILHLANTLKQLGERFEQEITEVVNAALEYFNITSLRHVTINGRQIFHNDVDEQQEKNVGMILSSSVVDYKNKISDSMNAGNNDEQDVNKAAANYVQNSAKIIETIAECSNCENSLQFNQCTKIVTEFLEHELDERIRNYEETYKIAVKFSGFIDRDEFDKAYGIQGNRVAWFSKQIFSEFDSSGTGYRLLNHLCQIQRVSDFQMLNCPEMKKLLGRYGGGSFYVFTSAGEVSHDKLISAVERVEDWSISRDSLEISSDGSITVITCKNLCNKELGTIILKNVNRNNGFVAVIPCQE